MVVVSITQVADGFLYALIAYETGAIIAADTRPSLHKAKLHAKVSLKRLGANFEDEVRRKKPTE